MFYKGNYQKASNLNQTTLLVSIFEYQDFKNLINDKFLMFFNNPFLDPLFDLLLDLATSHGPESAAANDGSHLTAVACACLLSLVVVRGDTGRLLAAIAALLMSPRALAIQNIQVSCTDVAITLFCHIIQCSIL